MKTKIKLSILAAAILCITSTAFADKLCLQTTVNRKTFKTTNKSVVAATCPRNFTELADTSRFQGPAGATGARGAVNLAACRVVSNLCNLNTAGTCDVVCADQEFVLQFTSNNSSGGCIVTNMSNSYFTYTNGLGYGVRQATATITNGSCSYANLLNAICCPVS
jgi:hypothetical protein